MTISPIPSAKYVANALVLYMYKSGIIICL